MLPLDFNNPLLRQPSQPSQPSQFVFLMFTVLFHYLSMLLPSRLLTLPKVSENMELSINSPKTIKLEPDTCTSSAPFAMAREEDGTASGQGTLSTTASSPSDGPDTIVETVTPRSMTPDSSVENEDTSGRKQIRKDLSVLWTEQSEKVHRADSNFTKPSC